jgi:hypothetical protein
MKRSFLWMLAVIAASALSMTCYNTVDCDDCGGFIRPPAQTPKDLTDKSHVLTNVELAYNKRRIDWYQKVLDQNFTFFIWTGDVNGGPSTIWNRADEVDINTKLFDQNNTELPCQSIFMDIRTEDGLSWIEVTPESAPTETWYQTTLFYDFKFEISPNTYIPLTGAKAVFTVRDAGTFGEYDHHWQLVEMSDLGDATMASTRMSAASTEPTTWGKVKSLYR